MYLTLGLTEQDEQDLAKSGVDPIELHQLKLREREVKATERQVWVDAFMSLGWLLIPVFGLLGASSISKLLKGRFK